MRAEQLNVELPRSIDPCRGAVWALIVPLGASLSLLVTLLPMTVVAAVVWAIVSVLITSIMLWVKTRSDR